MGGLSGRVENFCMQHLETGTVPAVPASKAAPAKDTLPRVGVGPTVPQNTESSPWRKICWNSAEMQSKRRCVGNCGEPEPAHTPVLLGMPRLNPVLEPHGCLGTPGAKHWHLLGHHRLSSGALQGTKYLWEKSPSAVKAASYFLPVSFRQ